MEFAVAIISGAAGLWVGVGHDNSVPAAPAAAEAVLSTLPSAGIGALLALTLFHQDLSIIAFIGIILLIGIVKKNAIMMIDFAVDAERRQGLPPEESIHQAALLRFRPIMMTTMAALLGALPLALGTGAGAELRQPLGITILGGLMFSQVLTLYSTPVVYLYLARLSRMFQRKGVQPELPVDDPSSAQGKAGLAAE